MTATANKNHIDMCQGPLLRQIVMFALPVMLSGVLQMIFHAADLLVIGRYGTPQDLAAVSANVSISNLIICILMGMAVGVNALAARYFGARDGESIIKTGHTAIAIALYGGTALGLVHFLLAAPALRILNVPEDVLPQAVLYMEICSIGIPGLAIFNFGKALLQGYGDTKRPCYYLVIAGILNIILNFFFVVVCKMQVAGVALATALTQWLSAYLTIRALNKEEGETRFLWRDMKRHYSNLFLRRIFFMGLPAGIQSACFNLANMYIYSFINGFGSNAMAGISIGVAVGNTIGLAEYSFSLSSLNFVSQNLGGRKFERIVRSIIYCLVISTIICLAGGWLCLHQGHRLLGFFTKGDTIVGAYGQLYFDVQMRYGLFVSLGLMDITSSVLRGFGKSLGPALCSIFSICIFRAFWVYFIFPKYNTPASLLIVYPLSWILCAALNTAILIPTIIKTKRELVPTAQ